MRTYVRRCADYLRRRDVGAHGQLQRESKGVNAFASRGVHHRVAGELPQQARSVSPSPSLGFIAPSRVLRLLTVCSAHDIVRQHPVNAVISIGQLDARLVSADHGHC